MQDVSRRTAVGLTASALVLSGVAPAARADVPSRSVDLQLVLAVDTSASVDQDRFELQRDGYAKAFRSADVHRAILSGPAGAVAVCMTHWMGYSDNVVAHKWMRLGDTTRCLAFADDIAAGPRHLDHGQTSISGALRFARYLFDSCPFGGLGGRQPRRVIDISGDGQHNEGRYPNEARDEAVAQGIVVNGLPILAVEPGLDRHYQMFVIGGSGAFMIAAATFEDFADAIRRKLVREIS